MSFFHIKANNIIKKNYWTVSLFPSSKQKLDFNSPIECRINSAGVFYSILNEIYILSAICHS